MYNILYKKIGRNYLSLIVICLVFWPQAAYSQDNIKTGFAGKVIDQYGVPLSGVEIVIKKSGVKIVNNKNGSFALNSASGDKIIVSHPNWLAKEVKLPTDRYATGDTIVIRMTEKKLKNPTDLDVVYGTVDKNTFLGSASTIYTDQLTSSLSSNIIASLAGRMPGLFTTQVKGMRTAMTGNNYEVDIFVGNRPFFGLGGYSDNSEYALNSRNAGMTVLIDGVQRELFSLDPENIESVSIQKDALSSMALGMRSSRSVLVITTKKPVEEGFQLSFTSKFGVQQAMKLPKPVSSSQYAYLLNEAMQNDGKEALYSLSDFEAYRNHTNPYTHPDVNWQDVAMKNNSSTQSYNLNAAGGGKIAQYYVGLSYLSQDGLFRSSTKDNYETNAMYKRYLISSKINVNVTNDFKLGVSLIGRIEDGNQPGAGTSNILNRIFNTPNNAAPVYNANGSFAGNVSFDRNILSQTINSGYVTDSRRDGMASITMDYSLGNYVKGLSARARGNISTQSMSAIQRSKSALVYQYLPSTIAGEPDKYQYYGNLSPQNNSFVSAGTFQQLYAQAGFNYVLDIGMHAIGADLSGDFQNEILNYDLPKSPANINVKGTYNYDKKYFAEVSLSRSYFNRYQPGKRWGTFFATGLGWDISKEDFLSDLDWINELKIRGVYGNTGNGIDNSGYYGWRQSYGTSSNDRRYPVGNGNTSGEFTVFELNDRLVNDKITWEKAHKINIGTDISLLNNKLQLTADFYSDKYYDLLQTRGKSIELIGLYYPLENIGKTRMSGTELSVTYQDNIANFNYFVTANWSCQRSKVLFMDEQYVQEDYQRLTNRPVGLWLGYMADGLYQSQEEIDNSSTMPNYTIRPGDIKYRDMNNDGTIDEYDKTVIGNDKPLTYFGFNLGFEYKGFEMSCLVQGAYNRNIYLADAGGAYVQPFLKNNQHYGQVYEIALNRWTPETASTATYPRLSAGYEAGYGLRSYNTNPNGDMSSFWVKSGNYIRLKDVNIAYTLPDKFSKNYLGGLRIKLFASGQNLLTKAAYSDLDPEVIGFESYPNLRSFNTGINIRF